ncbi:MAG: CDP-alcohol phosphatidyltransferase family protein [Phycisphaerae bacterium]|nr:CDP-alcohol phosphatidyltransferase family protein [Phycisphaerae bacterium]
MTSVIARQNWPNRISAGRILLVVPFVVCLLSIDESDRSWLRHVAVAIFAVMAVSDWLDGFLARRFQAETFLGKFLDPIGDKLLISASLVILAATGVAGASSGGEPLCVPAWVVVASLSKDMIVLFGFSVIYMVTGRIYIEVRRLGKWCTLVQLLLVLAMLIAPDLPENARRLPEVLWTAAAGLSAAALLDYVRIGFRFLSAHPPAPPRDTPS